MSAQKTTLVETMSQESLQSGLGRIQTEASLALLFHTYQSRLQTVTAHTVARRGKGYQIQAGRPLAPEDEADILSLLLERREERGPVILPENVLMTDRFSTMWWVPAAIREMHLHPTAEKRRTVKVSWPTLVMLAFNRALYVVALADSTRPDARTPVFCAPLANIWANTQTCTGSAKVPTSTDIESIPMWESIIFDTGFSHANHDRALKPASGRGRKGMDPMEYWGSQKSKKPFSANMLVPLNLTLQQWAADVMGA